MANNTDLETSFNLEKTPNPNHFSTPHPIISDSEEKPVLGFNNLSATSSVSETMSKFEENRFLDLQRLEIVTTQLVNSTDFDSSVDFLGIHGSASNVVETFEENQFLAFKESDIVTQIVNSADIEVISTTSLVADSDKETVVCDAVSEAMSESEENHIFNGPEIDTQLENFTDCDGSGEILGKPVRMDDGSVSNVVEFEEATSKFKENQFLKETEIETVFDGSVSNVLEYGLKVGNGGSARCSLKLELMDETALFDSLPVPKKDKNLVSFAKNMEKREKQEVMEGQKRVRRRGKGGKRGVMMNETENCVTQNAEAFSNGYEKIGVLNKKMYSRKEMEAMQYMNVQEQKKKWYEVYCGLGPIVLKEYDDLHCYANQKRISVDFDPRQQFGKHCEAAALPGLLSTRGGGNYVKLYVH